MPHNRAFELSYMDGSSWLVAIIQGVIATYVAEYLKNHGKVLWKRCKPSVVRLKGNAIFGLHFIAFLTGIESFGYFLLKSYARSKKSEGILITLFVILFAIYADASRKQQKTRLVPFFPIIKLV